ncbi:MAG: 5-oxoprolinase, partial [Paucimonas sp.]|nr:5-oxoprolinase [Paucimonas sp.]
LASLDQTCERLMQTEQVDPASIAITYFADVCYVGQSYYLEVPIDFSDPAQLGARLHQAFREEHDKVYGHGADAATTIVNVRAVHRCPSGGSARNIAYAPVPGEAIKGRRKIRLKDGVHEATIYNRHALAPGATIANGPAVFEQADTTTLMPPGWRAVVDASGALVLTRIEGETQ